MISSAKLWEEMLGLGVGLPAMCKLRLPKVTPFVPLELLQSK